MISPGKRRRRKENRKREKALREAAFRALGGPPEPEPWWIALPPIRIR
jgi:hypothetical protein